MSENSKAERFYEGDRVWARVEGHFIEKPATVIAIYFLDGERKAIVQRDGDPFECIYLESNLRKMEDNTWRHELAKRIVDGGASVPHLADRVKFGYDGNVYVGVGPQVCDKPLAVALFGDTYVHSAEKGVWLDLIPLWELVEEMRSGQ